MRGGLEADRATPAQPRAAWGAERGKAESASWAGAREGTGGPSLQLNGLRELSRVRRGWPSMQVPRWRPACGAARGRHQALAPCPCPKGLRREQEALSPPPSTRLALQGSTRQLQPLMGAAGTLVQPETHSCPSQASIHHHAMHLLSLGSVGRGVQHVSWGLDLLLPPPASQVDTGARAQHPAAKHDGAPTLTLGDGRSVSALNGKEKVDKDLLLTDLTRQEPGVTTRNK